MWGLRTGFVIAVGGLLVLQCAGPGVSVEARAPSNATVDVREADWSTYVCSTALGQLPTLRPSSTRTTSIAARALQAALIEFDFPPPVPIKVDGWYGPATASAVAAYQRSRGLTVDGVVGPQTWRQVRHEACGTPTSPAAQGTTTIVLEVSGCEGCLLTPRSVRQVTSGATPYLNWKGPELTVSGGRATFTIPTANTRGMSIEVAAPWERGDMGAVPLVALSTGHPSEGDPTTTAGAHCWTGTSATRKVLTINVQRKTVAGMGGGKAVAPMAYLTSLGPLDHIPGHQDLPYCTVPR